MSAAVTARAIVSGFVQGVGYRYFVIDLANILKVNGLVRNLPDGKVEVIAQAEKEYLDRFIARLSKGPASARVAGVDVEYIDGSAVYDDFRISY